MAYISEEFHKNKLKKYNINIKTKYVVGDKILERNTNDSYNDDIKDGVRCKKEYYIGDKLSHVENEFDTRIEYSFISKENEKKDYTCPNCGMHGKLKDFIDGCPYCGTYYNMEYKDKNLGGKYHYDRILKNPTYRIVTGIVDLIFSIILSFIFIKATSRTFNSVDVSKVFIYGVILALVLYYFFYLLDAYVVLKPIKKYKDMQNQKQIEFWNRTKIDKKTFYNNFNYEIRKKFYNENNIMDYDLLDYLEFIDIKKDNNLYVKVKCEIRLVYLENNTIKSKISEEYFTFKKINDDILKLKDGENLIKCYNCGASINVNDGKCSYCQSEIKYFQEWILVDNN